MIAGAGSAVDGKFWRFVDVGEPDGCWLWTGVDVNSNGYGRIRRAHRRRFVHRYAYELANGPTSLDVCHSCNVRLCCNPAHLYADTNAGNLAYMVECGRQSRGSARHNARLTEQDVKEIRTALSCGSLQKHLAAKYGVRKTTIQAIAARRNWAWLP